MTQASLHWGRVPVELRSLKRWCVAGPDKSPYAIGPKGLYRASDTDPNDWGTFDDIAAYAYSINAHIGFVLCAGDGLTCIDLDVKNQTNEANPAKWTSQAELDRYWRIVQAFDSYTEKSRSGLGLHTWVKGEIGLGCRRQGVEVYSQARFMITTGNVVLDRPIAERDGLMGLLVSEIRAAQEVTHVELEEIEETEDDATILQRAMDADNGDKFNALCACTCCVGEGDRKIHGSYQNLGYPTQSEADLALMSIFTFYSASNEQCRRLFRMSSLGQREKAQKDNRYLNRTLKIIRGRQSRELAVDADGIKQAAALVAEIQAGQYRPTTYAVDPLQAQALAAAPVAAALAPVAPTDDNRLPWPPGFAGALAGFIYQSSPRPIREVAIVATIGLLAGICGKAYCIPQSGLNVYMVLVARSAIGKEALHSGLSMLMAAVRESTPAAMTFLDFNEFSSGQALQKGCATNQSFCNVSGEWGRKLKRLAAEDGRDGPMQTLRTVMTNLYQKSGPASIVGGLAYSKKEDNVASVSGVAYSMIGETTPGTFFKALTESMMEDGFLSRFSHVEYEGQRPPANPNPLKRPDRALTEALCGLAVQAMTLLSRFQTCSVLNDPQADTMLREFDLECDAQINSTDDESWRQMWNRAHLKVYRLAALLAVADNWLNPVVNHGHVTWALDLVKRDIALMEKHMAAGDVGLGDSSRERKLLTVMGEYLAQPIGEGYKIPETLRFDSIVPRKFLQIRCARVSSFTEYRMGANMAMDNALRSLCDNGYIQEVDRGTLVTKYSFQGKAYRIINLPDSAKLRKR